MSWLWEMLLYMLRTITCLALAHTGLDQEMGKYLCTWHTKSKQSCHCSVLLPVVSKMAMLLQTLSGEKRPSTLQGRQWRNLSLIHPWEQPDDPRAVRTAGEEEEAPRASSNGNDCCHGNSSYVVEEETGTSCGWVIVFSLIFSRTAQYCVAGFQGQKGRCPSASRASPVALPTECRYLYTTLSTEHSQSPSDPELPCTIFTHLTKFPLAFCRCEIKGITKVPLQL